MTDFYRFLTLQIIIESNKQSILFDDIMTCECYRHTCTKCYDKKEKVILVKHLLCSNGVIPFWRKCNKMKTRRQLYTRIHERKRHMFIGNGQHIYALRVKTGINNIILNVIAIYSETISLEQI